MTYTVVIVAGDCGFGFEKEGYYDNIVKRNSKRMNKANNWIVFIRGNHDNPAYFDGKTFAHKRFMAVPDYSVIRACGHVVLCVGGPFPLIGATGQKPVTIIKRCYVGLATRTMVQTCLLLTTIGAMNHQHLTKRPLKKYLQYIA